MKSKTLDFCLGVGIKLWLTLILLFIAVTSSRACAQEPSTEHIKRAGCSLTHNKEFTSYGLHYSVVYSDGKPDYALAVEANSTDLDSLYDQCKAFALAMDEAMVEESIKNGKAEMKRQKDEHFFLNAKLAKK